MLALKNSYTRMPHAIRVNTFSKFEKSNVWECGGVWNMQCLMWEKQCCMTPTHITASIFSIIYQFIHLWHSQLPQSKHNSSASIFPIGHSNSWSTHLKNELTFTLVEVILIASSVVSQNFNFCQQMLCDCIHRLTFFIQHFSQIFPSTKACATT